nr:hypothetical protein [Bacillus sp. OK048]
MNKWSGSTKGLISSDNYVFQLNLDVVQDDEEILYHWNKDICEYRLHYHLERKAINPPVH